MSTARVTVLTRAGCHLCEAAVTVVAQVVAEAGTSYAEVDIDTDPELTGRWSEFVPVILVDGEVHDWFRVQPDRLRAALGASG